MRGLAGVLLMFCATLALADANADWPAYGRTPGEQRFSPLEQINKDTVGRLGLAWTQTLEHERGLESTPLVIDGVMYLTGAWSVVYAFDAARGLNLMDYAPQGGGFPIHIKGTGVVGAVTVSGVPERQDHGFVVEMLCRFLGVDHKMLELGPETA